MTSEPENDLDDTDTDVSRESYTWTEATRDIALLTRLTLTEASKLTFQLSSTTLIPYDAAPRIIALIKAESGEAIGDALRVLLTGDERPLYEVMDER
jgi:hypothetical protein